ncbi:MAG TPA: proline/glycine betaine ABC transporter permease [Bacillota bacterium]
MEWLIEFPEAVHLPLSLWVDALVDWLDAAFEPLFDGIALYLGQVLRAIEQGLLAAPWSLLTAMLVALGWRVGGWRMAGGVLAGFLFIGSLGMWEPAMSTLAIVITATLLAVVVAVPTGIAMARSDLLDRLLRPLLDLMQTMPSFVYLIPAIMLFSLGPVPALLATFIYAVPPAIRLTNLGIRQVDHELVEAARAFGSTSGQMLMKVQLPLALPTIMAGINQTIMMALAMVVIASMIGAGGLGQAVLRGISQLKVGEGFVGGISIVVLAIIIDRLTERLAPQRGGSP